MTEYTGPFDPALAYDNAEPEDTEVCEGCEDAHCTVCEGGCCEGCEKHHSDGPDPDDERDREWDDNFD